jgi:hypothetical protein
MCLRGVRKSAMWLTIAVAPMTLGRADEAECAYPKVVSRKCHQGIHSYHITPYYSGVNDPERENAFNFLGMHDFSQAGVHLGGVIDAGLDAEKANGVPKGGNYYAFAH